MNNIINNSDFLIACSFNKNDIDIDIDNLLKKELTKFQFFYLFTEVLVHLTNTDAYSYDARFRYFIKKYDSKLLYNYYLAFILKKQFSLTGFDLLFFRHTKYINQDFIFKLSKEKNNLLTFALENKNIIISDHNSFLELVMADNANNYRNLLNNKKISEPFWEYIVHQVIDYIRADPFVKNGFLWSFVYNKRNIKKDLINEIFNLTITNYQIISKEMNTPDSPHTMSKLKDLSQEYDAIAIAIISNKNFFKLEKNTQKTLIDTINNSFINNKDYLNVEIWQLFISNPHIPLGTFKDEIYTDKSIYGKILLNIKSYPNTEEAINFILYKLLFNNKIISKHIYLITTLLSDKSLQKYFNEKVVFFLYTQTNDKNLRNVIKSHKNFKNLSNHLDDIL